MSELYSIHAELVEMEWDEELNSTNDKYLCAFLKDSGEFAASGSLQHTETETIELGIDVLEEYRNIGTGN